MGILDRILRAGEGKKLKALEGLVPEINALGASTGALSDDALRAKTGEFRQRVERGETLDDLLVEAFAVSREAAERVIGQRHYDVQLMGGAALHFGWVAEMKTGEGKTLVSTLPAYLNGLGGKGVHLITVNDYLARRDAEWMGRIHKWLGLDVGLVIPGFKERPAEKRLAWAWQSSARNMASSAMNSRTQSAIALGSGVAKNMPVRCGPSATIVSQTPPRPSARTGVPSACASIGTIPKSSSAAKTKARAVPIRRRSSASGTNPANDVLGPASPFSRSASGPSPATIRRKSGSSLNASTTARTFL